MEHNSEIILRILARLLRSERLLGPLQYEHQPLTAPEARKIYFYYRLGGVLPLRGFAERLNAHFAPAAIMRRDLCRVFEMRYHKRDYKPVRVVFCDHDTPPASTCKPSKNKGTITKAAPQKPLINKRRAKISGKKPKNTEGTQK